MKPAFILFVIFISNLSAQKKVYEALENYNPPGSVVHQADFNSDDFKNLLREQDNNWWSSAFTVPGIPGNVYSAASDGENLYIAGQFGVAGSTIANNIVRWDGENWHSLGEGLENGTNDMIQYVTCYDDKVFVGGAFTKAGTKDVNAVAYWDGYTWHSLGDGIANGVRRITIAEKDTTINTGFIYSLYGANNKIYIGGYFNIAGDNVVSGITSWDLLTGEWENFNGGLGSIYPYDPVYAFSFIKKDDDIFVGGKFYSAGGVPVKNIAKWNGSDWSPAGDANGWVQTMEMDNNGNIYAAGFFDSIGTIKTSGVARLLNGKWESVGDVSFTPPGYKPAIKSICFYNNSLYIGGFIENMDEQPASGIARWDGVQWHVIPGLTRAANEFLQGNVFSIKTLKNKLYVLGGFTKAGEEFVSNVVIWNESLRQWEKIPDSNLNKGIFDGAVYTIAAGEDGVYAGGDFTVAGGVYARNIAKWNGSNWESVGTGYNNGIRGTVYDIVVDGKNVFVGGYFGSAGTTEAYHIAKWDGENWSRVGIGVGGIGGAFVNTIKKVDNYLYAGGYFSIVGDFENYERSANSIARYNLNTETWESIGDGIELWEGTPGFVYAIESAGNYLYAAGNFTLADNQEAGGIAVMLNDKWSGNDGVAGVNGIIREIKEINNEIYIGGNFNAGGGSNTKSLARWDGNKWVEVGGGLYGNNGVYVASIIPFNNGLIAGGYFSKAGESDVSNIAVFNGSEWFSTGLGTNGTVMSVELFNEKIFAAGSFDLAGGLPSVSFGSYELNATSTEDKDNEIHGGFRLFHNYPNPFNPSTTISYFLPEESDIEIVIYDMLGSEINKFVLPSQTAGAGKVIWYGVNEKNQQVTSGIYVCRFRALTNSKKLIESSLKLVLVK